MKRAYIIANEMQHQFKVSMRKQGLPVYYYNSQFSIIKENQMKTSFQTSVFEIKGIFLWLTYAKVKKKLQHFQASVWLLMKTDSIDTRVCVSNSNQWDFVLLLRFLNLRLFLPVLGDVLDVDQHGTGSRSLRCLF